MTPSQRIALWLACTLASAAAALSFQAQNPAQEAVIRVNVDLVQVDAVVTNARNEPVTDLKAEDFILLQDGKPQEITHFSYIRTKEATPPAATSSKAPAGLEKSRLSPLPPPMPLKREKVRRTIALIVDDLGLSFDTTVRVRQSIRKWIDNDMQPNDLVAVMRTGGGIGALQQFTNDKRMLYDAADRINYNAASRVGVSSFQPTSAMQSGSEERDLLYSSFTLESIERVVNGLRDLPGRKSMILFSESMNIMLDGGRGQSQGRDIVMKERMRRLVDRANRSAVVIHAIDPRGVVYTGLTAEDGAGDLSPEDMGNVMGQRTNQLINSQDGMVALAQQTGGLFVANRNDIGRALEVVADDGQGYYLLGYQPDSATISEMKKGKPKFHSIQVRVKRPGLLARSRSEFFSSPDTKASPDLMTRQEQVGQALQSPFAGGTLRVRLTALFSQTKEEKSFIHALLHFDTNQLVFSEEPEGWHKASIEVTAGLFSADGRQIDFADRTWNLLVKGQTYQNMKKNGASFLMRVPVKEAGTYQMRLVLRDTKTRQLGSAMHIVEVPDVREGKLALSGIVLAADKSKSEAAAVDQAEGLMDEAESDRTPAVRVFEPNATIAWAYQILNAKTGGDHKPQLQAQVRLFHEGREVYTGKPLAMTAEAQEDSKRMIAVDQMHFTKLPPGYYIFQIIVTDMLAKEKQRTTAQSIDFEVKG